jgi:uncharacterized protein
MKTIKLLLFCCLLCFVLPVTAQITVDSVPNQKLINGSYVSNPDGIIFSQTVSEIDTILSLLERQTTVQVAVVALQSIGENDIDDFSQKLFNTWGIGNKTNNNGLLILLVKDQRKVRFHTGYGLEGPLPDITCKNIQMNYMVPLFKEEKYDEGVLAGVKEVVNVITNPVYAQELKRNNEVDIIEPENSPTVTASGVLFPYFVLFALLLAVFMYKFFKKHFIERESRHLNQNPMKTTAFLWLIKYVFLPLVLVLVCTAMEMKALHMAALVYLYYIAVVCIRFSNMQAVLNENTKQEAFSENITFINKQQKYLWLFAIVFPLPYLPALIYYLLRRKYYRNHPRSCPHCKSMMHKLNETEDDEWLSDKQKVEEQIKSVDYDVWECSACQTRQQLIYPNRFTKYSNCPTCKAKTYYMDSDTIVKHATYHSTGEGMRTYKCCYCFRTINNYYTISKLTASSSSSSGSSSSSSSSSSSGGSWGGGSSGGGGASSSW